jgi:hypothetical protein
MMTMRALPGLASSGLERVVSSPSSVRSQYGIPRSQVARVGALKLTPSKMSFNPFMHEINLHAYHNMKKVQ